MTDNEKYAALLKEVGELLADKNSTIALQDFQLREYKREVAELKKKVEELESDKVCKTRIGVE